MFPLWFILLGGSFVFLDMGPCIPFRELDVSLVVHPLRWFFCLLGHGSLYSLSVTCFSLFMIDKVSSSRHKVLLAPITSGSYI
jgi:hypothetical protein